MAKSSGKKLTKFKNGSTIVTADVANALYGGLHGSTEGDAYVTGDPVISGHIHDGSHADGHAQKVNVESHVTGQLKNANLGDGAVVARNVQGFLGQSQAIPEFEVIGPDTFYYLDLSDLRTEFGLIGNEDESFMATNEYYVDTSATDNVDLRIYSTLTLAIAAAESEQASGYVIRLREGQTHTWNSPAFTATQDCTIVSLGNKNSNLTIINGTIPLGLAVKLTFCNLNITQSGGSLADLGANNLIFESCRVTSLTGLSFNFFGTTEARETTFIGTKFQSIGSGGVSFQDCFWSPGAGFAAASKIFDFAAASTSYFKGCDFDVSGISNWTIFNRASSTPSIKIHGCNINVENTGGLTSRVFGNSASLSVEIRNTQITRTGTGIINFGAATMLPGYTGLSWHGIKPNALDHPAETWFIPTDISFLAANEYYVDSTAAANTEQRIYATVATAVAAAEAEQADDYILKLREGQSHSWDWSNFTGNLGITLCGTNSQTVSLTLSGASVTGGAGVEIRFLNICILQTGNITDSGNKHTLVFDASKISSPTGLAFTSFKYVVAVNGANFINTRFPGTGNNGLAAGGFSFYNATWESGILFTAGQTIFEMASSTDSYFKNFNLFIEKSNWTAFSTTQTPTLNLNGCALTIKNTGGGTASLFGASSNLNLEARNVSVTRNSTGTINFGSATVTSGTEGISWHGTTPNDNTLPGEAWRSAPVATGFATVVASGGTTQVLKSYDISDLLVTGGSFKIRWHITLSE